MVTRSEQYRASEERSSGEAKRAVRAGRSKPGIPPAKRTREKLRAEKKATYAMEPVPEGGRPSRRSTRKSTNRAKPDTAFNYVEELRKSSPTARFRRARACAGRGGAAS